MIAKGIRLALLPALFVLLAAAVAGMLPAHAENGAKAKITDMWAPGDSGQRMNIRGRVTSVGGLPIVGAKLFVRQADGNGTYTQNYSSVIETDAKGRFQFGSVVPGQYTGVKHVHILATHDAYHSLRTEILFKGDPLLDNPDAPNAIFLEESTVSGETILYGRFDISLQPL